MRFLSLIILCSLQITEISAADIKLPEIEMVLIEGGTFSMGLDEAETEHAYETPKHEVVLDSYKIGKYEVTQELWEAVTGENPSIFKGKELPVENVSWKEIQNFIKRLNKLTGKIYRLPTEAEWEYAARGGNKSKKYAFVGGNEADNIAWHFDNSEGHTHNAGLLSPNELGLYDMGGNVSEWTQDWFGHYSTKSQKNPKGPKSSDIGKVFRGGNWAVLSIYNHPGCRFVSNPNFKSSTIGLRLAE